MISLPMTAELRPFRLFATCSNDALVSNNIRRMPIAVNVLRTGSGEDGRTALLLEFILPIPQPSRALVWMPGGGICRHGVFPSVTCFDEALCQVVRKLLSIGLDRLMLHARLAWSGADQHAIMDGGNGKSSFL